MSKSTNNYLFYGELVDATQNIPDIQLYNNNSKVKIYTPTVDTLINTFYIDDWGTVPTFNRLSGNFLTNKQNIKSIKKFKGLNTSSVTSMDSMFSGCTSLTIVDLSKLNTGNVTDMTAMFSGCTSLTIVDLSNFDISNLRYMDNMFRNCTSLTIINLNNLNLSNVTSMNSMFSGCTSLTDVYIDVEATLMKLTNNLTAQGGFYIPASATIHYNGTDYKWQNNAWTAQS